MFLANEKRLGVGVEEGGRRQAGWRELVACVEGLRAREEFAL